MIAELHTFYNRDDYEEITRQEMASSKPLGKPSYTHTTENKIWRIVKDIFSAVVFPIGLYRLIHRFAGKLIVPASQSRAHYANYYRKNLNLQSEWKLKRISIEVDGSTIDAVIVNKLSTLKNGRWVLSSLGNGEVYEHGLHQDSSLTTFLSKLEANALVFNYPGVGGSSGMPSRSGMTKAYQALLNFLEDQEKGLCAREIIGHGYSLGGGVQGDALRSHQLKQGINYVFVKSHTFSDLSTTASQLTNRLLGFIVKALGWNIDSFESSKKLKAPEIILQTAKVLDYEDISKKPETILHDGIIAAESSLAKKLLEKTEPFPSPKYFMGTPERHNHPLQDPSHLVDKINEMLKS